MRLLYVSRSFGIHDEKFTAGWGAAGIETKILELSSETTNQPALLRKSLIDFVPDLVQVGPVTYPGELVSDLWDGPLIATSWGFDLLHEINTDEGLKLSAQKTLSKADVLFSDNKAVSAVALALGASLDAIVEFPWGLEYSWLNLPKKTFTNTSPIFISTRNHEPIYRVSDLIRGFAASKASSNGATLVIAGSGSETNSLLKLSIELNVQENTKFVGPLSQTELKNLLLNSDVYLSASETDGSSVSLLEAMASGLCVVVSDIPGNSQWVNEDTGWKFELGNTEQLTEIFNFFSALPAEQAKQVEARKEAASVLVNEKANWEITKKAFRQYAQMAIDRHLRGKTI